MRYDKQPISIADQVAVLKSRGMVFDNEHDAVSILENIGYFRLAGYWRTMELDSTQHKSPIPNPTLNVGWDKDVT